MSTENTLKNMTTSSGYLANKTVYFDDVYANKLNGVPFTALQNEGNDVLAPTGFDTIYSLGCSSQGTTISKGNETYDYEFYVKNKEIESKGLPKPSTHPMFKNSAIGSRAGGVFGNQINVISANTNAKSVISPFTTESNVVLTDEVRGRTEVEEPNTKKIKIQDNIEVAADKIISFSGNNSDKKTVISQGSVITSEIGDECDPLKVKANGVFMDTDIEMANDKKIMTAQLEADEYGTLNIKADKIQFSANEITFDPESTEVTTGNFPQVIANLGDYEAIQKTSVNVYSDRSLKSDPSNALFQGLWRLQMFYNLIIVKVVFGKVKNRGLYESIMKDVNTDTLYIHFPSDYYSHFCDFYGKEDEDYYITDTELAFKKTDPPESQRMRAGVYFNPKENNFLKLKYYGTDGKLQNWPKTYMNYIEMRIGDINFGLGVSTARLKKQYVSTTPSTFMNKPDFYETITPRKKIKVPRLMDSDIYKDNITQAIYISNDLPSDYEMQAAVSATRIHRIAYFEVRFSFVDKHTGLPASYNDVIKIMKGFGANAKEFLITFIPTAMERKFAPSDTTNTEHIAKHPINGVKFKFNPKAEYGLGKGIIDFSEAKCTPCDEDVSMSINFWHITSN